MGYSQLQAVNQSARKLHRALTHIGLESEQTLPVIEQALDAYAGIVDPLAMRCRLSTGEMIDLETLAARYEELRIIQANRREWGPVWAWTQRMGLVCFVIIAIIYLMGLR